MAVGSESSANVGAPRRRATATSAFGVSRRENHDASGFYARFTAPTLQRDDVVEAPGVVDQIYVGDARHMGRVRPSSVALVVTSPPHFAGKAYEEALGEGHIPATYVEYLTMLEDVFAECVAKLEAGGRIAVNVANLGRKPYRSLSSDVIGILQDRLGLLLRGEAIWRKARGAGGNRAWGSFKKPPHALPDKALDAAVALLGEAGFSVPDGAATRRRRFAGGLAVDAVALDGRGQEWLVLVAGASTVVRNGLRRSDVLFRTLGEASVLTAAGHPVLVRTTDLPARPSAALSALRDPRGRSLVDALELGAPGAPQRLAEYAAGATTPVGDLLAGS